MDTAPWIEKYTAGYTGSVKPEHTQRAAQCYKEAIPLAPGPSELHEVYTGLLKPLYAQRDPMRPPPVSSKPTHVRTCGS